MLATAKTGQAVSVRQDAASTSRVTGVRREDDVWVVPIHLTGDFPGGEADLDQRFTVRGDTITDLAIG